MENSADVIIAGAGLAGLMCLHRLSELHPEWRFIMVEREARIGGRTRPSLEGEGSWSCGLQALSATLYDYLSSALPLAEEQIPQIAPRRRSGVLSAQKISEMPFASLTKIEMARALGGSAATKEWPQVEELLNTPLDQLGEQDQTFAQAWKGDKKSAALVVLEPLAQLWGLPELGPCSLRTLVAQAQESKRGQWSGRQDLFFLKLIDELRESGRLRLETRAQIMAARYEDLWTVASTRGAFSAPRLLVAQSPWEAILWLPKDLWPTAVLNLSAKTKPVSLVILSDIIPAPCPELPETLLIPAEEVQVISDGRQLTYQATLPYELTVQAPAVVKAIKRLKRAKKKLAAVIPGVQTAEANLEHIALLPLGWAHSAYPAEQRWFAKIDPRTIQKAHLGYCGDAYGGHASTDLNLIASVEGLLHSWK